MLLLDCFKESLHLSGRPQVMNPFGTCHISDKLPISWCQPAMAQPNDPVAVHSAPPHGAVLRPALWSYAKAREEALRHPPVMRKKGQVNVDQRIRCGEPLPGRSHTTKAINDPLVSAQKVRVYLQVRIMRNLAATGSVLDRIYRVKRQSRQFCQPPGECRFATAGIAEDRDLSHAAHIAITLAPQGA